MVRQRFLHYYCLNELLHVCVLIWLWSNPPFENLCLWVWAPARSAFGYILFYFLNYVVLLLVLVLRRTFRPASRRYNEMSTPRTRDLPKFRVFEHTARDGVKLRVQVSDGEAEASGTTRRKVILLAEPLGQCGPDIYKPIFSHFGSEFVYVTWDYRGFFGSSSPRHPRRISIHEHAEDAVEVLRACGFAKADAMVGHSMGTVVALETALLFPDLIGSIVLLNAFHGHVFSTAFQPLVRVPCVGDFFSVLIEFLLRSPHFLERTRSFIVPLMAIFSPIYARVFGSALMRSLDGDNYLVMFLETYLGPLCASPQSLENYLRLFQELDAHSVYHLLPTIAHPVLLISGFLDPVTPAMQSVEIARRIPHAVHYCDPFSSHASILESPERCVAEIAEFLEAQGVAQKRHSESLGKNNAAPVDGREKEKSA